MHKTLSAAMLVLVAATAQASTTRDLESSAVVNGSIVVAKDGSVQSAVIDHPEKYGQPIADMVQKTAMQWRFHPVLVDGQPVLAKSSMHARVVVKKTDDGNYTVRVKGASFGDYDANATDELRDDPHLRKAPKYPQLAVRYRVQGTVYLSLHVDRSGHVTEAVARQVNLENIGDNHTLEQYRKLLAKASIDAAREWTFRIPTTGPLAAHDSWTANVPINYTLNEFGVTPGNHVWETYLPGPYTPAPWVDQPDTNAVDAIADNNVHTEGVGPALLNPASHN